MNSLALLIGVVMLNVGLVAFISGRVYGFEGCYKAGNLILIEGFFFIIIGFVL